MDNEPLYEQCYKREARPPGPKDVEEVSTTLSNS